MRLLSLCCGFWLIFMGTACTRSLFSFTVHYDHLEGLQVDDPVVFEDKTIGRVTAVTKAPDSGNDVRIGLEPDQADAATDKAIYLIADHPDMPDRKAVKILHPYKAGQPLKAGDTVNGAAGGENYVSRLIDALTAGLEAFAGQNTGSQNPVPVRTLEEQLAVLKEELKNTGTVALNTMDKELAPLLDGQIASLQEKLEKWKTESQAFAEDFKAKSEAVQDGMSVSFEKYKKQLEDLGKQLQELPASQAFDSLESQLKAFAEKFGTAGGDIQEKLQKQVLPFIEKQLEETRKYLEEKQQKELAPIEESIKALRQT